ncbi:tripartite tricarboxylate transporter TctB family protein [Oceaniglobus trochenteri]|uniref:tripartite tricarboxylate transporter TctB family protein n=1 Tax=Oceaniglobus trochenteri TaxID=2763260 RepID=UPI001CFFFF18|nr:tripartite tricarboxylate transporter TctB family protein [Oceaniglobus trochenteri]
MGIQSTEDGPVTARLVAEWVVAVIFLIIVAIVFQQIATNMADQGIASGGAYNDAASYPRALAIAIAVLLAARFGLALLRHRRAMAAPYDQEAAALGARAGRALALLALFALYLVGLGTVGYLLSSLVLVTAVLALCGERRLLWLIGVPLVVTFGLSIVFGGLVNVVLPRGQFGIALPW